MVILGLGASGEEGRSGRAAARDASAARGRPDVVRIPLGNETWRFETYAHLRRLLRPVKTKLVVRPEWHEDKP